VRYRPAVNGLLTNSGERHKRWDYSTSPFCKQTPRVNLVSAKAKIQEDDQQIAASALKFTWQVFDAVVASDYDVIFAHVAAERFDAVYVPSSPLNVQNKTHICQLVSTHRIPAAAEWDAWAKCGFLLTYGEVFSWGVARAMDYVDKILRGAKPSDLPVEQATKFLLTINLRTAKELGLTVPPSLLVRADEVIE